MKKHKKFKETFTSEQIRAVRQRSDTQLDLETFKYSLDSYRKDLNTQNEQITRLDTVFVPSVVEILNLHELVGMSLEKKFASVIRDEDAKLFLIPYKDSRLSLAQILEIANNKLADLKLLKVQVIELHPRPTSEISSFLPSRWVAPPRPEYSSQSALSPNVLKKKKSILVRSTIKGESRSRCHTGMVARTQEQIKKNLEISMHTPHKLHLGRTVTRGFNLSSDIKK